MPYILFFKKKKKEQKPYVIHENMSMSKEPPLKENFNKISFLVIRGHQISIS